MDTYICVIESLCCPPETVTTLWISYTLIQNKKSKKRALPNVRATVTDFTGKCGRGRENKSADLMEISSSNVRPDKFRWLSLLHYWEHGQSAPFPGSPVACPCWQSRVTRTCSVSYLVPTLSPSLHIGCMSSTFPWELHLLTWWSPGAPRVSSGVWSPIRNSKPRELDLAARHNLNWHRLLIIFIYPMCEYSHFAGELLMCLITGCCPRPCRRYSIIVRSCLI